MSRDNRILTVGVIGGGAIAQRRHLPEYAANRHSAIAGVFDMNRERTLELAEDYNCKAYISVEEMLSDPAVQAVSVCTPNAFHAEYTIAALKAGKAVLCEKPMAVSLKEAGEILDAQKESGKILMLGHNQRLIAAHRKAREIIRDGGIGKPLFFQCNFKHAGPESWSVDGMSKPLWFFEKNQANFGVMGDLGAHKIDLIRFLLDDEIDQVFSTMMTLDKRDMYGELIRLDDNVICEFRMCSGMPGIMHFSWTNYGHEDNSTIIYGDKGVMKIFGDYANDIVLEMRDGSIVRYDIGGIATNTNQTASGVIDEFVNAVLNEREPIVRAIDGYNTIAVIEAAVASNDRKEWVKIENRF